MQSKMNQGPQSCLEPWIARFLMQIVISIVAFYVQGDWSLIVCIMIMYYDNSWMLRMQKCPDLIHSTEKMKIYSGISDSHFDTSFPKKPHIWVLHDMAPLAWCTKLVGSSCCHCFCSGCKVCYLKSSLNHYLSSPIWPIKKKIKILFKNKNKIKYKC